MKLSESNNKLWSGRFEKEITKSVLEYTHTADIDTRLIKSELWGSIAHVLMLSKQNILRKDIAGTLIGALLELLDLSEEGAFKLDKQFEDVHLNVENYLITKLGIEIGGQVHTARSRNDQVVTDTRLYLHERILDIHIEIFKLINTLLDLAKKHTKTVIVGYTHGSQPNRLVMHFGYLLMQVLYYVI